ncbi:hypothetical protein RIF29_28518 [Crotalaria pallida]|uniref:Uncharacterized protein n=1 Tax=Crotalaria pallida TaxID=3830 RepID=A0AAN9HWK8_CROPI
MDSPSSSSSPCTPPPSLQGVVSATLSLSLSLSLPTPPSCTIKKARKRARSASPPLSSMMKKAEKQAQRYLEENRKWQQTEEALEAKRIHQIRILMLKQMQANKKNKGRLVWTNDLHQNFRAAVNQLGLTIYTSKESCLQVLQ